MRLSLVPVLVLTMMAGCFNGDNYTVADMAKLPVEDISQNAEVRDYLAKHKVYISLTSSPTRLKALPEVLDSLDVSIVDTILLTLPEKYRNVEEYEIPNEVRNYPRLQILRTAKDLGPGTKIIPTMEYVQTLDPDAIVLSIDDDVAYPKGMVKQLVKLAILEDAVIGGQGRNIEFFGIHRQLWPQVWEGLPVCGESELSHCDIVEGVGSVAYKARFFDVARLKRFIESSKDCLKSDDLYLHFHLAEQGIKRLQIKSRYMPFIKTLPIGFGPDALHKEGGSAFANIEKYQKCVRALQQFR